MPPPRAYPKEILAEQPVINDTLGGGDLVIVTPHGGNDSRAFLRAGHNFVKVEMGKDEAGSMFLVDDEDLRWRLDEDALVLVDDASMRLQRVPSRSSYWFGWHAFYPATEVYGPGPARP